MKRQSHATGRDGSVRDKRAFFFVTAIEVQVEFPKSCFHVDAVSPQAPFY